jgi:hypothetical protein
MNTEPKTNLTMDQEVLNAPSQEIHNYVIKRYDDSINYYWKNGGINKNIYKRNRILVIVLGALVTLLSSLISASFVEAVPLVKTVFAIVTPVSAALLTIINGLAERLEKERDRYLATPEASRNYRRELNTLNSIIVSESTAFFKRILDSEYNPDKDDHDNDK